MAMSASSWGASSAELQGHTDPAYSLGEFTVAQQAEDTDVGCGGSMK